MSSDDPIEPIHGIENIELQPARSLRDRGYHVFTRFLENTLAWRRFQLSNQINKSKQRRGNPKPEEPQDPEKPSGFDAKA